MNEPTNLAGLRALVAASSKGLGFAVAKALADRGCHVTINGRDEAALAKAAANLRERNASQVNTWQCDITQPDSLALLEERFGGFDILVTNAEGPMVQPFDQITRRDILNAFESNTAAMLGLIQTLLPGMRTKGFGRIVNILSTSALRPIAGLDASAASRAALIAVLRSTAVDAISYGVTINHVLPGPIKTERTMAYVRKMASESGMSFDETMQSLVRGVPAGRIGQDDEVGLLCAFLCARTSGFITGQSICIDGGLTIS